MSSRSNPWWRSDRHVGPFLDDIPHPERSLSFWYYNTSKRGITLNLEAADGTSSSGGWPPPRTSFWKPSLRVFAGLGLDMKTSENRTPD